MNTPPTELINLQRDFSQAIFSREREAISSAVLTQGELSAEQRVGIYRNSVHGILWKYLGSLFEVCEQLLGEQFFEQLCDAYIDSQPPNTPFLNDYGAGFPQFIQQHESLKELIWIADVAKLEWARHLAWNAVNQESGDFSQLGNIAPEEQLNLVFQLPSSASLLQSAFAIHDVWLSHQPEDSPEKKPFEAIELHQESHVLVWRQERELHQNYLNVDQWHFLRAVEQGANLEALSEQFAEAVPVLLSESIQHGWIISFKLFEK